MEDMQRVTLANGIELDVLDVGPKDAPALIFLHGFPESHRTWRHQIAHFSPRFRCIAPDQRGYRGSSKPEGAENYSPDKLIGDVFQLADALGIAQFTILGHDWGGALAWGVALLGQGTRVTRAVIANAPHPVLFPRLLWTDPQQREASQYMRAFRDTANDALVREHGLAALLMKALNWNRSAALEDAERDALFKDWSNPDAAIAMLNWYRASPMAVPPMDRPRSNCPQAMPIPPCPCCKSPTLVIWAMDDLALPPCNLDGMDKLVANLTIEPVHDCGHFVPWEAPDKVNAALDRFLG